MDEGVEPALEAGLGHARHRCRRLAACVEWHKRLARVAIAHELEAPEAALPAHIADRRVALGELRQLLAEHVARGSSLLDDPLVLERLDRCDSGGTRERVPRVREAAGEEPVLDRVVDVVAHGHRAERDVARVDALGGRDDVRDDVPVLAREPAAGPAPARHHLVEDEQDAVAVAHLPDRLEVAVRRDDDPVRADDRLEDDRGHRVRALVFEDLLEVRAARADGAGVGMAGGAAVRVGVEHADDAGNTRLREPAPRVAGERDRSAGRAVVRAVARNDLVTAGHPAREPDRVLVRLGAAVREERVVEVAGHHLCDQARGLRALVVRHRRPDRAEQVGLVLDRLDDTRMLVADRDVDELRREVEVAFPVVVPEVAALGSGDRERRERRLHGPRVDQVRAVVRDDAISLVGPVLERGHDSMVTRYACPMTEVVAAPAGQATKALRQIDHWIDGKRFAGTSGRTGPVYNPATGEQTKEVAFASRRGDRQGGADGRCGVPRLARDVAV